MALIALILLIIALLGTAAFIIWHNKTMCRFTNVRVKVKETVFSAMLGAFMWLEVIVLCYLMYSQDFSSYTTAFKGNIIVFLAASILLGVFTFLYYFVKGVYVFDDKLVYVSIIGKKTEVPWSQISEIKITQTQRVKLFYGEDNSMSITIGGEKSCFREFLRYAIKYIPKTIDKNSLISMGIKYKV